MFFFVFFLWQGANGCGKTHNSSAASKLKHLQQNSTDKSKNGKREDFLSTGGQQQQVAPLIFSTVTANACLTSLSVCAGGTAQVDFPLLTTRGPQLFFGFWLLFKPKQKCF